MEYLSVFIVIKFSILKLSLIELELVTKISMNSNNQDQNAHKQCIT